MHNIISGPVIRPAIHFALAPKPAGLILSSSVKLYGKKKKRKGKERKGKEKRKKKKKKEIVLSLALVVDFFYFPLRFYLPMTRLPASSSVSNPPFPSLSFSFSSSSSSSSSLLSSWCYKMYSVCGETLSQHLARHGIAWISCLWCAHKHSARGWMRQRCIRLSYARPLVTCTGEHAEGQGKCKTGNTDQ